LFSNRCASSVRTCSTCTPNDCTGYNTEYTCSTAFGSAYEAGASAKCSSDINGRMLNLARSSVRIPNGAVETSQRKEDICTFRPLDTEFVSHYTADKEVAWQYVGTMEGVFRQFPARTSFADSAGCVAYDPRIRPW
jgi:hypothetical protein